MAIVEKVVDDRWEPDRQRPDNTAILDKFRKTEARHFQHKIRAEELSSRRLPEGSLRSLPHGI